MVKYKYLSIILMSLFFLFNTQVVFSQGIIKTLKLGSFQGRISDYGDEGEGSLGYEESHWTYYDGFENSVFDSKAVFLGCKNFTDTTGTFNPIKVSGNGQWESDPLRIWRPVPDKDGYTIHRYLRYQPPAITVDGFRLDDPFPLDFSDHVAPDKIPGTADGMVESWINTDMGITIHQRVFAFTQKNHDDYFIYEWTIKNTGNTDLDPEIELPNQTLEDVYLLRQVRYTSYPRKRWASEYGFMPGDSLRILYGYPARWSTSTYDDFGEPDDVTGFLLYPWFMGEAILFGSNPDNMNVDDENQPSMTGAQDCDAVVVTNHSNDLTPTQRQWLYKLMSEGFSTYYNDGVQDQPGSKPGHHSPPYDHRGYKFPDEAPWFGFTISGFYAYGPYDLAFGDSFKVAWAEVVGHISPEKGYEIGSAWKNDDCHWGDDQPGGSTEILPPQYQKYPELYEADAMASEVSNWAKDNWVYSGRDTIFRNAAAANWAYQHNLNVPAPPPAPSIEVKSLPEKILIEWGDESEVVDDFAGYRVYRAKGSWYAHIPEGETKLVGVWEPIFECGEGTGNPLTHSFEDKTAQRGIAYYYYVAAFDNGKDNPPDFNGKKESLESGRFLNMTTQPAHLTKPAGKNLDDIRIVPNPFNLAASEIQFTGEPDKIAFLNLPEKCTIKIYTESGDLVKTIEHFGSGDESWGRLAEEHMVTDYGQQVVSGLYFAYIETPDGKSVIKKFVIVR
ncbi:MAG: hypothetical protein J7L94_10485 [Caldisericaceae bacterium]|nr:hypothetical protein [Caldisericaceae bacterium]